MSAPDPIRDCPHGRQKGKCDTCDVIYYERILTELREWLEERLKKSKNLYELQGDQYSFAAMNSAENTLNKIDELEQKHGESDES